MPISISKTDDILIAQIIGQVNSENAGLIETELLEQINQGESRIVLNLSGLDYISSAGLRVVLVLAKTLKNKNGVLALCEIQPLVQEVFEISGFLAILNVFASQEQAVANLS